MKKYIKIGRHIDTYMDTRRKDVFRDVCRQMDRKTKRKKRKKIEWQKERQINKKVDRQKLNFTCKEKEKNYGELTLERVMQVRFEGANNPEKRLILKNILQRILSKNKV